MYYLTVVAIEEILTYRMPPNRHYYYNYLLHYDCHEENQKDNLTTYIWQITRNNTFHWTVYYYIPATLLSKNLWGKDKHVADEGLGST